MTLFRPSLKSLSLSPSLIIISGSLSPSVTISLSLSLSYFLYDRKQEQERKEKQDRKGKSGATILPPEESTPDMDGEEDGNYKIVRKRKRETSSLSVPHL